MGDRALWKLNWTWERQMSDGANKSVASAVLGGLATLSVFWAALHTYFAFDVGRTPTFSLADARAMLDDLVIAGAALVAFSVFLMIAVAKK